MPAYTEFNERMVDDMIADKKQQYNHIGPLAKEIGEFINFKRQSGSPYTSSMFALKAFDRFCNAQENRALTPQQLAEAWVKPGDDKPKYDGGCCVRQLGQYLTTKGHPKAFTISSAKGNAPRLFGINSGPFVSEIKAFVEQKRSAGRKYVSEEYCLKAFDKFCSMKKNEFLTHQQLADTWCKKVKEKNTANIGMIRELGLYLTMEGSTKGRAPKPPYLFSEDDIELFFGACAKLKPDEKEPSLHIVLPAAYLFMHCLGVRTCELKILMGNVNFENGEVTIVDSKTGDRVVYMSDELSKVLFKYNSVIEKIFPHHKYLFPASVNRSRNDFAKRFKEIWASYVLPSRRGEPRLYDFRHHLLYRNVELCMSRGEDVNVLRPYLMRHMGHKLPESFQYYFHLSPSIQKEITKMKTDLDWMIPDILEVPYE